MRMDKLWFASDYMEGAHPTLMRRLLETNLEPSEGYGTDRHCERARALIRDACACEGAAVHFLVGGTQANLCVIDQLLMPWQGVVAAETGHISTHEAGAIEGCGHKVLTLPETAGKLSAKDVRALAARWQADGNREHTVMPGMVYISQPTEYGTLYTLEELNELSAACRGYGMKLYVDGARLAYALACPANDVTLPDLARLTDAFYIGGTKCGALMGEAVVFPDADIAPHFFTLMKKRGALLAKGRLLGVQYEALFEDGLYLRIGEGAIRAADRLRAGLKACGIPQFIEAPTNQVFAVLDNARYERLKPRIEMSFWETVDEDHTAVRLATGWNTRMEDVEMVIGLLEE